MVKLLLHINPVDLIEKVKTRPEIWNRKDKNHKNAEILTKLWMEIASEMSETEQHVKTRWKGLRDQYSKELRRLTENVFSNRNRKKPIWRYFEHMDFLKDQVGGSHPSRRFVKAPRPTESAITWNDIDDDDTREEERSTEGNDFSIHSETTGDNDDHVKFEQQAQDTLCACEDDDTAFFISLLPHIRKIPEHKKLQCQIDIQSIVHRHLCDSSTG